MTFRVPFLFVFVVGACSGTDDQGEDHTDHAGDGERSDVVTLSKEGAKNSAVALVTVTAEPLTGAVGVPAEVQLDPDRVAHVTPLVEGQVIEVKVRLGDQVVKGETLATLLSVALGEARAELSRARSAVHQASAEFERQEKLRDASIGAERNFLAAKGELDRARSQLAAVRTRLKVYGGSSGGGAKVAIRSPQAGVVIERHATPGEVVDGERPLFVIADVSRVFVLGRVYEQDVASATLGSPATVSLQAYPGKSWDGTISYVAAVLDEKTRTLPIRIDLDNPDGILRPGLFGRVALLAKDGTPVPALPESAITRIDGRVKVGDSVVTSGVFVLKSELLRGELAEEHGH